METSQEKENLYSKHMESTPQSKLLVIEREFNVPVDQLFNAFTTSEALKSWWWPTAYFSDRVDIDFREGGKFYINMKGTITGGMIGEFEEILNNELIVMTDQFADVNGRVISAEEAKMPGEWPEVGYITFNFNSVDENTSNFKLSQQGIPNEMQRDCIQGWNESFDKLEKYLSDRKH